MEYVRIVWDTTLKVLVNPFVDVVIGAIVSGVYSYKAAMDSANKNIQAVYTQERKVREAEKKSLQNVVKTALLSETKQNLEILRSGFRVGFANMSLNNEMWTQYKGNIDFFPESTQECLVKTYASISRYNSTVEAENAYISSNRGGQSILVSKIQEMASEIMTSLEVTGNFIQGINVGFGGVVKKDT